MSRIIAYYRVSTDTQVDSGAGLKSQEDICKEWAQRRGKEIHQSFTEKAISGAAPIDKRPALFNAVYSLEAGDILLVSRLDRLSRDLYGGIIIDELVAKKKASVASAAGEGTEGDDPSQMMIKNMFRVVSGFERNLIQFRIKAALAAKKSRGEKIGGILPFGYDVDSNRKLIHKPEEQAVVQKMIEYRQRELSLRKIANALNSEGIHNRNGNKWNAMSISNAMRHTHLGTKHPTRRSWD